MGQSFSIHPFPGVGDRKHDVITRHDFKVTAGEFLIQYYLRGFDAYFPALWHGIASIHHQINQDLLDLRRIGFHLS